MPKKTALIALLALALGGCSIPVATGGPTGKPSSYTTPTGTPEPADPSTSQAPTEEPTEEPADDKTAKFGDTFKWADELKATLSRPRTYHPSKYAAGDDKYKTSVVFTVTVTNGTKKAFDPTLFFVKCTSGEEECGSVIDLFGDKNIKPFAPQVKVLVGRKISWQVAFNVKNPKDLIIEVTPSFKHDSAIWTY